MLYPKCRSRLSEYASSFASVIHRIYGVHHEAETRKSQDSFEII